MVLSTDYLAIMKNEGELYAGLEKWDRDQRIEEFKKRLVPARITPSTNRGVRIGMSEAQVRGILGRPKQALWSKKFDARELIYKREEKWAKPKSEGEGTGQSWTNYYLFRGGKLFYIELANDLEGGA